MDHVPTGLRYDAATETLMPDVASVTALRDAIRALDALLDRLLRAPLTARSALRPSERVTLDVALAFAAHAAAYAALKLRGVDASRHPIRDELARVKAYVVKARAAEAGAADAVFAPAPAPALRVDAPQLERRVGRRVGGERERDVEVHALRRTQLRPRAQRRAQEAVQQRVEGAYGVAERRHARDVGHKSFRRRVVAQARGDVVHVWCCFWCYFGVSGHGDRCGSGLEV